MEFILFDPEPELEDALIRPTLEIIDPDDSPFFLDPEDKSEIPG